MNTILLANADRKILDGAKALLELAGYQVYTAISGTDALKEAEDKVPDLILSDTTLAGIDGFSLLHLVRKKQNLTDTPFLFLTKDKKHQSYRRAMNMGADDFIPIPFTDTELLTPVEYRLQKAEEMRHRLSTSWTHTSDLSRQESSDLLLKTLFEHRVINRFKKKSFIFSEGNHPMYLFYVKHGTVKAFKSSENGKELTVGLYVAGDFMGYTALLEESVYQVTTRALEDCEIALIPKQDFFELVSNNSLLALQFIRLVARNNNQKAAKMVQLAYDSLRKRVANSLLLLKKKCSDSSDERFLLHITREELANLSGTSTESLIRTLSDFKSENLISIVDGHIELINEHQLKNLTN